MLFAIDIGNSRIKTALFIEDKIISKSSFIGLTELSSFLEKNKITNTAICSVVPDRTKSVSQEIIKITDKPPFIVSKDVRTNLKITYKTPETLGVDRICSAEGAFYLHKNSDKYKTYTRKTFILSVDFGTATTVNVIEFPDKFIGGLITPGVELMFESLNKKTAQLPGVTISDFTTVIGESTNSSIASGVLNSVIGMIEKVLNSVRNKYSANEIIIYITGGNAKAIIPYLDFKFVYEESLVLFGINALYKLNK